MNEEIKYRKNLGDHPYYPELIELKEITSELNSFGAISLILLTLFLLFVVANVFGIQTRFYLLYPVLSMTVSCFLLLLGFLFLFKFNLTKNRGLIIYEELSDEIDWSTKRKEFIHKPSLDVRIVIREFIKSTDLPFTEGLAFGQVVYLLSYLLIFFINLFFGLFHS